MNRAWFLLLAFSLGLNGAFLYDKFMRTPHDPEERPARFDRDAGPPWMHERHGDSLPHMGARLHMERRLDRMVDELDLTDQQRAAIHRIHEESIGPIATMREETGALREAFHELMVRSEFDSARFREVGDGLHAKQRALETAIMDNLIREAALLTPEQRERYQNMMMGPWRNDERGGPMPRRR